MKLSVTSATIGAFAAFTAVEGQLLPAGQDAAVASSSHISTISSSSAASPSSTGSSHSQSVPAVTVSPTFATELTFTLKATNPTAVPLSLINSNQALTPTKALSVTPSADAVPTNMPSAPKLPNVSTLRPADYPPLDKIPPVDSPEVQQWIQEVKDTGIVIPDMSATKPGGCGANADIVGSEDRCWWTCGGCTRSTDITECPTALDWGLTYDDGPSPYTPDLLAYLDEVDLKSTFFVVGSRVISYPAILQAEYMAGHQIAVHTWSHPPLTTLTNEEIIAELGWTRKVVKDVLGVTPNMMRPPTGDIDDRVRAISLAMGLTPVMWSRVSSHAPGTFDTDDFRIVSGQTSVHQVLNNWENIMANATTRSTGFIVLEHDLYQQTVEVATGYILPDALAHKPPFKIQPVISCLGKEMHYAYVETNDNKTNPPEVSKAIASGEVTVTGSKSSATATAFANSAIVLSPGLFSAAGLMAVGLSVGLMSVVV